MLQQNTGHKSNGKMIIEFYFYLRPKGDIHLALGDFFIHFDTNKMTGIRQGIHHGRIDGPIYLHAALAEPMLNFGIGINHGVNIGSPLFGRNKKELTNKP